MDLKTLQTAEKLARFVAQVGPEIEQFSIENSADNPDLWYVVPSATHSSPPAGLVYLFACWFFLRDRGPVRVSHPRSL